MTVVSRSLRQAGERGAVPWAPPLASEEAQLSWWKEAKNTKKKSMSVASFLLIQNSQLANPTNKISAKIVERESARWAVIQTDWHHCSHIVGIYQVESRSQFHRRKQGSVEDQRGGGQWYHQRTEPSRRKPKLQTPHFAVFALFGLVSADTGADTRKNQALYHKPGRLILVGQNADNLEERFIRIFAPNTYFRPLVRYVEASQTNTTDGVDSRR